MRALVLLAVVLVLFSLAVALRGAAPPQDGMAYYVDCSNREDAASGRSEADAWRSVKHVSSRQYHAGRDGNG